MKIEQIKIGGTDAGETDIARSNSLADLAARINAEHEAVGTALRQSVHHAMNAGDMLIEVKDKLKPGAWLPWLCEKCSLTERTAQRYMRLARNRASIEANTTCVSDLSINGALAFLTVPREAIDDNLRMLEPFVDHLDAEEALAKSLRSQAETARRKIVLDGAESNLAAMRAICERLGFNPNDDRFAVSKETEGFFDELGFNERFCLAVGAAYEAAVETDDYDRAVALAEWLFGLTVDLLALAQKAETESHTAAAPQHEAPLPAPGAAE
jgi:hypothetical protein